MKTKTKIKIFGDRLAWKGKYNRIITREFIGINGKRGTWEIVERKAKGVVVIIIPVTKTGDVIFLKHFRIPRNGYVIESPAGLMDKIGESPRAVARRELLEETGYRAQKIIPVARVANNSGLMNEDYQIYLATDCEKVAETTHENAEDIELIFIPLAEVETFFGQQRKISIAAPMYSIPYFLRRAGLIS